MDRLKNIEQLKSADLWDIIIIGGGATGLGIAVDAASRGYRTLLLEQSDFAKGTSSRSTKLAHGGVRYLAQGNIKLVLQALRERGMMLANAPHLVKKQEFIIPCYQWFEVVKYLSGLKIYDAMAGKHSFGKTTFISKNKLIALMPNLKTKNLKGGIQYLDGQFDDARFAIHLAQTAENHGATLLNYVKVKQVLKSPEGKINGVIAHDMESHALYTAHAKVVINATGVFVDDILKLDKPDAKPLVKPSQGVHLVLDKSFIPGKQALMIPQTSDGRVLFAIPWHDCTLIGTTDTPINEHSTEPKALKNEVDFILENTKSYFRKAPTPTDIKSVFAGLRPLAMPDENTNSTKEISRHHQLLISPSQLITITGGKWTTYRQMAEDTVNKAIKVADLFPKKCITKNLHLHAFQHSDKTDDYLNIYGSDKNHILKLAAAAPELQEFIHPNFPFIYAEVLWTITQEMAVNLEDVLARRIRLLFLDAKIALEVAPNVAIKMAEILNKDQNWINQQVEDFGKVAANYKVENIV